MRASGVSTLRALAASTHPGPTLVVTALSAALGVAAALDPWRIAVLAFAVLCGQVSIGLSNDATDAARDRAVGRDDKPVARGDVSERTAWLVAGGAVAVALGLSMVLSPEMAVAHGVFLISAWAYNLGLKSTPVSIVPFLVSFGLLPSLATLSAPHPSLAAAWASAAGASLGAAVHLTNVLPDLDDDRATGVRGLPHRLGARASAMLAAAGLLVGALAVLLGPVSGDVADIPVWGWALFGAVTALAAVSIVAAIVRPPTRTLFRLVMAAALLLAAQLVLTGAALTT